IVMLDTKNFVETPPLMRVHVEHKALVGLTTTKGSFPKYAINDYADSKGFSASQCRLNHVNDTRNVEWWGKEKLEKLSSNQKESYTDPLVKDFKSLILTGGTNHTENWETFRKKKQFNNSVHSYNIVTGSKETTPAMKVIRRINFAKLDSKNCDSNFERFY
ncbi:hypothetical protein HK099_000270, partial [Clydaea vesicula]